MDKVYVVMCISDDDVLPICVGVFKKFDAAQKAMEEDVNDIAKIHGEQYKTIDDGVTKLMTMNGVCYDWIIEESELK